MTADTTPWPQGHDLRGLMAGMWCELSMREAADTLHAHGLTWDTLATEFRRLHRGHTHHHGAVDDARLYVTHCISALMQSNLTAKAA